MAVASDDARISPAIWVQMHGYGAALISAMKRSMARSRAEVLGKSPRASRRVLQRIASVSGWA